MTNSGRNKLDMNEKIKKFIGSADWVFAKTYAKTAPHEYAIRKNNPNLEKEFICFVRFIRENGYEEKFWSQTYTYYDIGEHKYWTMGNPIDETTILNRVLIKRPDEETNI